MITMYRIAEGAGGFMPLASGLAKTELLIIGM